MSDPLTRSLAAVERMCVHSEAALCFSDWITIGGSPAVEEGVPVRHHGGTPVKVDEAGEIEKGPKQLEGKTIGEISAGPSSADAMEKAAGGTHQKHIVKWNVDAERKNWRDAEALVAQLEPNKRALNYDETYAVVNWSASGYRAIRIADQDGPGYEAKLTNMGRDVSTINQRLEFLRAAYEKLPVYEGIAYRGLYGMSDEDMTALRDAEEMELPSFSSFTLDPRVSLNFSHQGGGNEVVLKIRSKSMRHIAHLSDMTSEFEVLARKGQKFKIDRTYMAEVEGGIWNGVTVLMVEGHEV